jgi:hypothetical protein
VVRPLTFGDWQITMEKHLIACCGLSSSSNPTLHLPPHDESSEGIKDQRNANPGKQDAEIQSNPGVGIEKNSA